MSTRRLVRLTAATAFAAIVLLTSCSASSVAFPDFTAPVVDVANAVTDSTETALSSELEEFRKSSGPQIAVAVIETTGEASIEDYSIDLARAWGVGDEQRDDGVLILVALNDRKLRIDVGSGVEGDLTDVQAGRIVDEVMLPLLRVDDVDGAVIQGSRAVMSVWRGEQLPAPSLDNSPVASQSSGADLAGFLLFLFFVGGSILLGIIGQFARHTTMTSGGSRRGYGGIFIPGGFGGGGFGGGGGFSGGFGGGFGGGGAGGSW